MKWISVKDELPKEVEGNIIIACWTKTMATRMYPDSIYAKIGGNIRVVRYYKDFGWSDLECQVSYYPFEPCDYWLDLPQVPQDVDKSKLEFVK